MRKLLIGLALSLASASAQAQWVLVDGLDNSDKTYADPSTKRRTGNIVRMWDLSDYAMPKIAGGKPYLSDRVYRQYDCDERSSQLLQLTVFPGRMATGDSMGNYYKPNDKVFIAPGTVAEALLNFACN